MEQQQLLLQLFARRCTWACTLLLMVVPLYSKEAVSQCADAGSYGESIDFIVPQVLMNPCLGPSISESEPWFLNTVFLQSHIIAPQNFFDDGLVRYNELIQVRSHSQW